MIAATTKVDALQREFRTAHKGYTGSVADLLALDHSLGKALGDGVVIALDVSPDTPVLGAYDKEIDVDGESVRLGVMRTAVAPV